VRLSVIGCGYLGIVHAASMVRLGHDVVAIDVDRGKITSLRAGRSPVFEPGLDELLARSLETGRLSFSDDPSHVSGCDAHFIAVGTPQSRDGLAADLGFVRAAIESIRPHLRPGDTVIGKSTVPVGTARDLANALRPTGAHVVWNPEFLREGHAIQDTISPDRLVYGVEIRDSVAVLDEIYRDILSLGIPRLVTDLETAELVKVAANAFLATKISFINAMAEIAEAVGGDIQDLADAIGIDARIGRSFLNAGVGFGGGCLPKDIRAFVARAEELGRGDSVAFLKEVDAINLRRRRRVVELAIQALGGGVVGRRIAILGLSFKPESDDVRDSPALDIAVQLKGLGADVVATDPRAIENARARHPQLSYAEDTVTALAGAELTIVVTEWGEYRELAPERVAELVAVRRVIDGRNIFDPRAWRDAGWDYWGLGRA
jgi:UDPglucose 6-dehydrogenase